MLLTLQRIARTLFPVRPILLVLAFAALIVGIYAALSDSDPQSWRLRLSLLFSLWSLMLFAFIQLFCRIPVPVLPKLSWMDRQKDRIVLFFYKALALFVIFLTLLLLYLSLKLILL